ncbi:hypothetical protein HPB49_022342 [Dermacentor silvarum]|uniref:Uncharacterized protein n=1 Tax=Dermacentor silvarum TaxID=543639 RepID=A0ACB8D8I0_DERSI|nr:uncharacterized protein LOC119445078 [Dermacentor silvarum]KAH7960686.1 hypothetical protein HPB49_022342 [Dermacentor silvarum]
MTSPQYELSDLMELAEICSQARENSGLAAAAASPTNVGRESTYNIPIHPTNVGVPNPAHLTNTPAHVGELPNLFSSLGEILVPSVRAVNITDYGGGSQRPVSNGEGSLAATRVPRTSENFGVHYLGLNSDGVVPTTTARAPGAAAPATLGGHPVWPNGTITSALGRAARSPRVTEPDSDPFPVNTGTSAIGPDSFGGSNSGGKPADAANPVHFLASALQQVLQTAISPGPRIGVPIPTYSGYGDQMSANVFLLALRQYEQATGMRESAVLERVLPVALVGQAARWYRLVGHTASTMDEFRRLFRDEFLPYDYRLQMRRELELRTQAPDESLVEYVRAMQELFEYADPSASNTERVERVIRQSHPTFALYLRSSRCRDLNELAAESRRVQAEISAARAYRPPPPPSESLEPSCAWHGSGRTNSEHAAMPGRSASATAPFEISDRALDPYACGWRTAQAIQSKGWCSAQHHARSDDYRPVPKLGRSARNAITDGRPQLDAWRSAEQPGFAQRTTRNTVRCFNCAQTGHIARECPNQQGNETGRR